MRVNGQIAILWVLLLLMAAVFVASYRFPYVQAKLAPMTISGLIVILCSVQLVRERRASLIRTNGVEEREPLGGDGSRQRLRYLIESFWVLGFAAAVYLFGFIAAIPLLGIFYMKTHGKSWTASVLIAAMTVAVVYFLFTSVLDFSLYPGLLRNVLGPFFLG